ncbi:toxin-antitoxin system YwqK family antitoxin [Crocinitomicaceae bacterium]|nr:toxin-antitoxin system YwqK family antitoxin [Crocinitomicaceae bacterium]
MKYLFVFLLLGLVSCGDASSNASENVKPKLKEYWLAEVTMPNDTMFVKKDMKPLTGVIKEVHENGQLAYEYNFKDGELDGSYRVWYENGQLKKEGNNKDGNSVGLHRGWYEDGQLKYEEHYEEGKKDGLFRAWHENGQLENESNFKDDKLDGSYRVWYEDGQLKAEKSFKYANCISAYCYDFNGNNIICD